MRKIHFVTPFILLLALAIGSSAHAATKVNLLLSTSMSRDYARGVEPTTHYGKSYGVSLMAPSVASNYFNKSKRSGGNSNTIYIDLDFGIEIGAYHKIMAYDFGNGFQERVALKLPLVFWLEINPALWIGGGYQLTKAQPPYDTNVATEQYGALAALRLNLFPKSVVGLAIDGRYNHGITNLTPEGGATYLNSTELMVSLRVGGM